MTTESTSSVLSEYKQTEANYPQLSPALALALPAMNTIIETNPMSGNPDIATVSLIYTLLFCASPFVVYGLYRTFKAIKRAATISYRNSLIKAFDYSDPIAREHGVNVEETLEGLLAAGGWDNVYAYLRNFSKNHPVNNEIANEKYRQASKPDFRRPRSSDRNFDDVPNLDPQTMQEFHNSHFDHNKKMEAEQMVGETIVRIQNSTGAEREKYIRHLDTHNKMMRLVVDLTRNR